MKGSTGRRTRGGPLTRGGGPRTRAPAKPAELISAPGGSSNRAANLGERVCVSRSPAPRARRPGRWMALPVGPHLPMQHIRRRTRNAARASAWGFESLRLRSYDRFEPSAASRPLRGFLRYVARKGFRNRFTRGSLGRVTGSQEGARTDVGGSEQAALDPGGLEEAARVVACTRGLLGRVIGSQEGAGTDESRSEQNIARGVPGLRCR